MIKRYLTTAIAMALNLVFVQTAFAQGTLQTIKGTVIDKQTQSPLPGVTVTIVGDNSKGTNTDEAGRFRIAGVSPGRCDVSFTFIGYKEYVVANVEVTSGKEVSLDAGLEEGATALKEVVAPFTKEAATHTPHIL